MQWLIEKDGRKFLVETDRELEPKDVENLISAYDRRASLVDRDQRRQQQLEAGRGLIDAETGMDWEEAVSPGIAALGKSIAGIAQTPATVGDIFSSLASRLPQPDPRQAMDFSGIGLPVMPGMPDLTSGDPGVSSPVDMMGFLSQRMADEFSPLAEMPTQGSETIGEAISEGPRGVAEFAARTIVEQAPQLALSFGTGVGVRVLAPQIKKASAAAIAAWATTAPQEAASAFREVQELTGEDAPASALVTGTLAGLLEIFGDAKIVKRMLGGDSGLASSNLSRLAAKIATRSVQQGARETGVETGQEILQLVNAMVNSGELPKDAWERISTAAASGLFAGAGFSAVTDVAAGPRALRESDRIRTEAGVRQEADRILNDRTILEPVKEDLRGKSVQEQAESLGFVIGSEKEVRDTFFKEPMTDDMFDFVGSDPVGVNTILEGRPATRPVMPERPKQPEPIQPVQDEEAGQVNTADEESSAVEERLQNEEDASPDPRDKEGETEGVAQIAEQVPELMTPEQLKAHEKLARIKKAEDALRMAQEGRDTKALLQGEDLIRLRQKQLNEARESDADPDYMQVIRAAINEKRPINDALVQQLQDKVFSKGMKSLRQTMIDRLTESGYTNQDGIWSTEPIVPPAVSPTVQEAPAVTEPVVAPPTETIQPTPPTEAAQEQPVVVPPVAQPEAAAVPVQPAVTPSAAVEPQAPPAAPTAAPVQPEAQASTAPAVTQVQTEVAQPAVPQQPAVAPPVAQPTVTTVAPAKETEVKGEALRIIPTDSDEVADANLVIAQGEFYYTLWIRPSNSPDAVYATILSRELDEARVKAQKYIEKFAAKDGIKLSFTGNVAEAAKEWKTVKLLSEVVSAELMRLPDPENIGDRPVGIRGSEDLLVKDVWSQAPDLAQWIIREWSGKSHWLGTVARYLKNHPSYLENRDAATLETERIRAYESRLRQRERGEKPPFMTLVNVDGKTIEVDETKKEVTAPVAKLERRMVKDQVVTIVGPQQTEENLVRPDLAIHMYGMQIDGANAAISSMTKNGVFLNGDGAGVGKTRQILAVASHFAGEGKKVFIITENAAIGKPWESVTKSKPPTLGGSMAKDAQTMGVQLSLLGEGAETPIQVTTYNRVKEQEIPEGAVLIFDESQNLANTFGATIGGDKEMKEWETKFRKILPRASAVAYYSATPADKPHQFAYLHKVLGYQLPEMFLDEAVEAGVRVVTKRFGGQAKQVYDVPQGGKKIKLFRWFNQRMAAAGQAGMYIKREISYEGTDVQFQDVKGTAIGVNEWASHLQDALTVMQRAHSRGYKLMAEESYILYAAELTKIGAAVDMAAREVKSGRKVIIYFSRIADMEIRGRQQTATPGGGVEYGDVTVLGKIPSPVNLLKAELEKRKITHVELHGKGKTTSKKAQDMFSKDTDVLLASIESGGTGINLNDTVGNSPRTEIFMYAPYRGISTIQAMGRIWRTDTIQNDNNPNRYTFIVASDINLDRVRSAVLGKKLQLMKAAVGGTAVGLLPMSKVNYDPSQLVGLEVSDDGTASAVMDNELATAPLRAVKLDWRKSNYKQGYYAQANADFLEWHERGGVDRTGLDVHLYKDRQGRWTVTSSEAYKPEEFELQEGLPTEEAPNPFDQASQAQPPAAAPDPDTAPTTETPTTTKRKRKRGDLSRRQTGEVIVGVSDKAKVALEKAAVSVDNLESASRIKSKTPKTDAERVIVAYMDIADRVDQELTRKNTALTDNQKMMVITRLQNKMLEYYLDQGEVFPEKGAPGAWSFSKNFGFQMSNMTRTSEAIDPRAESDTILASAVAPEEEMSLGESHEAAKADIYAAIQQAQDDGVFEAFQHALMVAFGNEVDPESEVAEEANSPEIQARVADLMQKHGDYIRSLRDEGETRYSIPVISRDIGANRDFATPPSEQDALDALSEPKREKFGAARSLPEGTEVDVRIDIPAFNKSGVYVITVHEPMSKAGGPGAVIGYDTSVRLKNPSFVVGSQAQKIRDGSKKFPVATVHGEIQTTGQPAIPQDIDSWIAVGMDPKDHEFFYDKRTDQPVIGGSEAYAVGNTVFVKDPVYGERGQFRYRSEITPMFRDVPDPATGFDIEQVVGKENARLVIAPESIETGKQVVFSLNMPAFTGTGTGFLDVKDEFGRLIGHTAAIYASNVTFGPGQTASGSVTTTSVAEAHNIATGALGQWVQVGMSQDPNVPFFDRQTGRQVLGSPQVVQVGALILARDPEYGQGTNGDDSQTRFRDMSEEDVEDAVAASGVTLNEDTTVRVVHNETVPWAGQVEMRDGKAKVTLNAAMISSPTKARETLYEELLHVVFADATVKDLWSQVISALTDNEIQAMVSIYGEEVAVEEAAIRRVIQAQPQGVFAQFVQAVKDAFRRLFGKPLPAERILLMRALKGMRGNPIGTDGFRYSWGEQRVRSKAEFGKAIGFAQGVEPKVNVASIVAVQQAMVMSVIDEIKKIDDPEVALAAGSAIKSLSQLAKVIPKEELDNIVALYPGLGKSDIQEIAGRNVLKLDEDVRALADVADNDLAHAVRKLQGDANPVADLVPRILVNQLSMVIARRLVSRTRGQFSKESLTVQVQAALQWVASNVPSAATVSREALQVWLDANGWKDQGQSQVMSKEAYQLLSQSGAIEKSQDLYLSILNLKSAQSAPAAVIADMNKVIDSISPDLEVYDQIQALEGAMFANPRAASTLMMFPNFRDQVIAMRAAEEVLRIISKLRMTPIYHSTLIQAKNRLSARKGGIFSVDIKNGTEKIISPTGREVTISYLPDGRIEERNLIEVEILLQEIDDALKSGDLDPMSKDSYRLLADSLRRTHTSTAASLIGTESKSEYTYQIPGTSWTLTLPGWNPINWVLSGIATVSDVIVPKYLKPIQGIMRKIPGRAGQRFAESVAAVDFVINRLRQLDVDETYGAPRRAIRLVRGAAKAGFIENTDAIKRLTSSGDDAKLGKMFMDALKSLSNSRAVWHGVERYNREVLNVIFAGNQSPGQDPIEAGSVIKTKTGLYKVKKSDIELAQYMKAYNDKITSILKDSKVTPALVFNPLMVEDGEILRQQSNYGLKVARDMHAEGVISAKVWANDVKDPQSMSIWLQDPDRFHMWVTQFWQTSNPEFWQTIQDEDLADAFSRIRMAYQSQTATTPFRVSTLEEFLDAWADISEQMNQAKTPPVQVSRPLQIEQNRKALFEVLDRMAKELVERSSQTLENVPDAIVSVTTGQSGMTMRRGAMKLHDGFYRYSPAEEIDSVRRQGAAVIPLQMRMLVTMELLAEAFRLEIQRRDTKWDDRRRAERANQERAEVLEGTQIMTTEYMRMLEELLTAQISNIKRNLAEMGRIEEEGVEMLRQMERTFSGLKLTNIGALINNATGSVMVPVMNNLFAMGKIKSLLFAPITGASRFVQSTAYTLINKNLSKSWLKDFYEQNKNSTDTLVKNFIEMIENAVAHNAALIDAGVKTPVTAENMMKEIRAQTILPGTAGRANEPSRKALIRMTRILSGLLVVPRAMSSASIQGLDNISQQARLMFHNEVIDAMKDQFKAVISMKNQAGHLVETGGRFRITTPITPAEMGVSQSALEEMRLMLREAQLTLEFLVARYHERLAQNPEADLFDPNEMSAVIASMDKQNNLVAASNVTDVVKSKGARGFVWQTLLRFLPYQFNQLTRTEEVARRAARSDDELDKAVLLMVYALVMVVVAFLVQAAKAKVNYLLTGKVPATPQPAQFFAEPTAGNFARVAVSGGTSIFLPLVGEAIGRALGNTSNKPLFNPAEAVPLFSDIANIMNTAQRMLQSRQVAMPLWELTQQLFPPAQIINRAVAPGSVSQANATRALRSASPIDIETRQVGGSGGRYTPASPLVTQLIRDAYANRPDRVRKTRDQLVRMYTANGMSEVEARRRVRTQIQAKSPDRSVFGRRITDTEKERILKRMTGDQRKAYDQSIKAFNLLDKETKVSITDDQKIRI